MKIIVALALLLTFSLCSMAQEADNGIQPRDLVRIVNASREEVGTIEASGVWVNYADDSGLVAEATKEQQDVLRRAGYRIETINENITGIYAANFAEGCDLGQYLTYQQFVDTMRVIAQNNSAICKLETLGTSYGGRQLLAMKVSDNPRLHENEPAVHFEGAIHGDEKIGWAVAFEMLKYLVRNYGTDTLVTRLVDSREIWLLPMYNPDGYIGAKRTNDRGVDLNRNWGWMWGNESSMGASPFSEPENRAVLAHILRHPLVLFVSFHSGTTFISYPWSYSPDSLPIPENRHILFLSRRYNVPTGYTVGQGYSGMYPINGSTKDFDFGLGMMGWSIEVHLTKTPAASEIGPTFNKNRPAMLEFFHRAGQGIRGTVMDLMTGLPIPAQILVNPTNWPSYNDTSIGDFHRFYLPGTYNVTFRSPGYLDTTLSGVVVPNTGDSSVTLQVQMMPDSSAPLFAFRFIYCSFVDPLSNRTHPVSALGPHDGVSFRLDNAKYVCLDMYRPVFNRPGPDLTVYRSSGTGTAQVQGSHSWDGPWTTIGTANSAQTSFDLSSCGLDSVRYVRLTASGIFSLDAIEGVNYPSVAVRESSSLKAQTPRLTVQSPARGPVRFTVLGQTDPDTRIIVRNAAGRVVWNTQVNGLNTTWDSRSLPAGVYFCRLSGVGSEARAILVK